METRDDKVYVFPDYLNQGSWGLAVFILKLFFFRTSWDRGRIRSFDNKWEEGLTQVIMSMQCDFGFTGEEVDGHFGPATKKGVKDWFNVDFDKMRWEDVVPMTCAVYPGESIFTWPAGE